MTSIKTSDLYPSGSDLFVNSDFFSEQLNESDLEELSDDDLATINGGFLPVGLIVGGVRLGLAAYAAYQAYQNSKQ